MRHLISDVQLQDLLPERTAQMRRAAAFDKLLGQEQVVLDDHFGAERDALV